jgi:hypothetical protein
MSCLCIEDMSFDQRVEFEVARAARLSSRAESVINALTASGRRTSPPSPTGDAGAVIPLCKAENAAMLEKQVANHPPLQICYPGHQPKMIQADGNMHTLFYVECPLCKVRTDKYVRMDLAAHAWAVRDVADILFRATSMVAA